jgi:hypothetical protein
MKRAWLLLALAGCYEPRRREPDPWERYERGGVPEGNIRIRVETFEVDVSDGTAFDAAFRYKDDDVFVAGGDIYGSNGITVFGGNSEFLGAIRASRVGRWTRRDNENFVLVADGHEAEMHVVQSSPMAVDHVIPVYGGAVVVRTIEQAITGSGMLVRPTSQSDGTVLVEVTPFVSHAEGGLRKTIRLVELQATLRVRPGKPVVLLSHRESRDTLGTYFFSWRSARGARKVLMVLTVEK